MASSNEKGSENRSTDDDDPQDPVEEAEEEESSSVEDYESDEPALVVGSFLTEADHELLKALKEQSAAKGPKKKLKEGALSREEQIAKLEQRIKQEVDRLNNSSTSEAHRIQIKQRLGGTVAKVMEQLGQKEKTLDDPQTDPDIE